MKVVLKPVAVKAAVNTAAKVAKGPKAAVVKPTTSALMQPTTLLANACKGAIYRLLPFSLTLYRFLRYNFLVFEMSFFIKK